MPFGAFRLNSLGRFTAPVVRTAKTVTVSGNAQISTAQSKFGGASGLYDGTGDFLTINSSDFSFGTSTDFTVECFVNFSTVTNNRAIFALYDNANIDISLYLSSANLSYYAPEVGGVTTGQFPGTGTWKHYAMSRSGSTTRIFLDGTQVASTTTSINITSNILYIGADTAAGGSAIQGYIDEFRVSNTARYTANFTAPTAAFTNDANTLLLLHCDGMNTTTVFTDDVPVDPRINGSGAYFVNNYWGNDVAYLGLDSSNRPVFAYAYSAVTTYYPTMFLFRVNTSDLSITMGSSYTLDGTFQCYYVSVNSERDGAGLRTSSGYTDYGYVGWGRINGSPTDLRVAAFSYDLNNLTATIGTALTGIAAANIYPVGNAGIGYIGNRQIAVASQGGNNGNFIVQNWVTRSSGSTTLTKNTGADNSAIGNAGQGGIHSIKGFSSGQWLMGYGTGNNGHGWQFSVVRQNSTAMVGASYAYAVAGQTPVYNTIVTYAQLNNTNRFISVCYGQFNTTVYHRATAHTVTWNTGATAPTIASGTTVDIGSASPANGLAYSVAPGKADGEAYFLHRNTAGFEYRKLTVSTNTITVGSVNSITSVSPPSTIYAADATNMIQIGSDWYWITGYRNQATGEIQFLVVKNPV